MFVRENLASNYLNANAVNDVGGSGQAGVQFHLGPESLLTGLRIRFGAIAGIRGATATGGLGIAMGRRRGALMTVDWAEGGHGVYSIVHVGGYWSIGGD